jgi:hypothetical protein
MLMTGYVVDPETLERGEALEMRLFPLVDPITRETHYDGSFKFQDINDRIVDFFVVGTPGGVEAIYKNATPVAQECVLTWCTQTLSSSLYWGQLSQNVTSTFINQTQQPFPFTFTDIPGDYFYTYNISLTPPDQHISPKPKSKSEVEPPNMTFGLDNNTALQTVFLTDTVVPTFATFQDSSSIRQVKIDIVDTVGAHLRPLPENPWLPPDGNVTSYVERLALASESFQNLGKILSDN